MFTGGEASVEELLGCADQAMYQAKEAGRNTVRIFAADIADSQSVAKAPARNDV